MSLTCSGPPKRRPCHLNWPRSGQGPLGRVEDISTECRQAGECGKAEMASAVIATLGDAEQVFIAAQRRKMVVLARKERSDFPESLAKRTTFAQIAVFSS